ncbi:hypothetical protein [Nonomuraea sp. NPDC002799]
MEAESSRVAPPTDLGGESAVADTGYDEIRDDVEVQEAELVPVETSVGEFDPQQQPAPAGPIRLITPNESTANPDSGGGLR